MCVCEREGEGERECVCVCVRARARVHVHVLRQLLTVLGVLQVPSHRPDGEFALEEVPVCKHREKKI